jgi:hypothetical protein
MSRRHTIAKDSSGKGNDLSLLSSPSRMDTEIKSGGNALRTGSLSFKNNVALNKAVKGMPEKSFTVEFWARSKKLDSNKPDMQVQYMCYCCGLLTAAAAAAAAAGKQL